jgi:hypothetical protein
MPNRLRDWSGLQHWKCDWCAFEKVGATARQEVVEHEGQAHRREVFEALMTKDETATKAVADTAVAPGDTEPPSADDQEAHERSDEDVPTRGDSRAEDDSLGMGGLGERDQHADHDERQVDPTPRARKRRGSSDR